MDDWMKDKEVTETGKLLQVDIPRLPKDSGRKRSMETKSSSSHE